jgi:hypothetical protein
VSRALRCALERRAASALSASSLKVKGCRQGTQLQQRTKGGGRYGTGYTPKDVAICGGSVWFTGGQTEAVYARVAERSKRAPVRAAGLSAALRREARGSSSNNFGWFCFGAFGQYGEFGPGFEQLLDQLAEDGADEAAKRCLIPNRVVAKGAQLRMLQQRVVPCAAQQERRAIPKKGVGKFYFHTKNRLGRQKKMIVTR